jgi:hypothetical protein
MEDTYRTQGCGTQAGRGLYPSAANNWAAKRSLTGSGPLLYCVHDLRVQEKTAIYGLADVIYSLYLWNQPAGKKQNGLLIAVESSFDGGSLWITIGMPPGQITRFPISPQ